MRMHPRRCSMTCQIGPGRQQMLDTRVSTPIAWGDRGAAEVAGATAPRRGRGRIGLTRDCRVVVGTGDEHGASARRRRDPSRHRRRHHRDRRTRRRRRDRTHHRRDRTRRDPRPRRSDGCGSSRTPASCRAAARAGRPRRLRRRELCGPRPRSGSGAPGSDGVTFLPTLSGSTAPRWNDRCAACFAGLALNHDAAHMSARCSRAARTRCVTSSTVSTRSVSRARRSASSAAAHAVRAVAADEGRRDRPARTACSRATKRPLSARRCSQASPPAPSATSTRPSPHSPCSIRRCTDPDHATTADYDEAYGRYRGLFDAVEPEFARLPA